MSEKLDKDQLDYMGMPLEIDKQEDYSELSCYRCGKTICYTREDNSLVQSFCTDCFDALFPEDEA